MKKITLVVLLIAVFVIGCQKTNVGGAPKSLKYMENGNVDSGAANGQTPNTQSTQSADTSEDEKKIDDELNSFDMNDSVISSEIDGI